MKTNEIIRNTLLGMADPSYKAFHSKLIPSIDPAHILGIPVPALRKYAKKLYHEKTIDTFMASLPHKYYEENNLHAFLIEQIRDFDVCIKALEAFLPFVDNWATCDSMRPKSLLNYKPRLLKHVDRWLNSSHSFTVRYGIEVLMLYFLEEDFQEVFLEKIANISHEDYYVKMMIAWYFLYQIR